MRYTLSAQIKNGHPYFIRMTIFIQKEPAIGMHDQMTGSFFDGIA